MNNRYLRLIDSVYSLLTKATSGLRSPFLLAVRLYWGWQFMQTGWGKLHNISDVTAFFTSLGIPMAHANAIMVANLEFFGGLFLILGFASRLNGLVLTGNMAVAYLTADRDALRAIFSDPSTFYKADPYPFLFAALLMLIFGAGYFSLDELIARRVRRGRPANFENWPVTNRKNDVVTVGVS